MGLKKKVDHKIEIANELWESIASQTEIESQVIMHIATRAIGSNQRLRIWKDTFLKYKKTGIDCKMLFSENIADYPFWTILTPGGPPYIFTLIFQNLPKECITFDLIEDIPEEGGFLIKNLERNSSNVYNLILPV